MNLYDLMELNFFLFLKLIVWHYAINTQKNKRSTYNMFFLFIFLFQLQVSIAVRGSCLKASGPYQKWSRLVSSRLYASPFSRLLFSYSPVSIFYFDFCFCIMTTLPHNLPWSSFLSVPFSLHLVHNLGNFDFSSLPSTLRSVGWPRVFDCFCFVTGTLLQFLIAYEWCCAPEKKILYLWEANSKCFNLGGYCRHVEVLSPMVNKFSKSLVSEWISKRLANSYSINYSFVMFLITLALYVNFSKCFSLLEAVTSLLLRFSFNLFIH